MVHGKFIIEDNEKKQVEEILQEVFIDELNYPEDNLIKDFIKQTYHVLLYEGISDECPVACGSLLIEESIAKISLIAVKKKFRRKMNADLAIRMLIDKAISLKQENIYANVPISLVVLFERIGFFKEKNSNKIDSENNIFVDLNTTRLKYNMNMWNFCQNNHHNVD